MDGSTDDSVTKSDREVDIESEREIQSNREGERETVRKIGTRVM